MSERRFFFYSSLITHHFLLSWLTQVGHNLRHFGQKLARQKSQTPQSPGEHIARARVQVNSPDRCLQRRGTARGEPCDDARERVARAGGREANVASPVA